MFSPARLAAHSAVAAAALGLAALASAGTAGALVSEADSSFVGEISHAGISYDSASAIIADARHVCSELKSDVSAKAIGEDILAGTDLTERQAATFVDMSMTYYCPQYVGGVA